VENKSWQKEIDFHCTFGIWPFKKSLDITPAGFLYCGELFPLKTITRLRWGVDQKRGGPFPKYLYYAAFGTETREFVIKTRQKDFYEHLTQRFWAAAGKRMLAEMFAGLRKGRNYSFGDFSVSDGGITITRRGLFKSSEPEKYRWSDLKWGIVNGNLVFTAAEAEEKLLTSASFLWTDNAHILSVALALLQKSGQKESLARAAGDSSQK